MNAGTLCGFTPLMYAAKNGHDSCITALIELGADVKIVDLKRATALGEAKKNGHGRCAEILVRALTDAETTSSTTVMSP